MKRNFYDIFDAFEGDAERKLPNIKDETIDKEEIMKRVFEKADIHPTQQKKRRPYRTFGIAAAAAIMVGGTITAGAVSGRMDEFFKSVSIADIQDAVIDESLPAVNMSLPDAIAEMEPYYTCPDVIFTETQSGKFELLGLYNDHNTLMLSFRLTVTDGTVLTDDMRMLPYFTFTLKDGTQKESPQGGWVSENFQKSMTEDNVYYLTYYLVDPELSASSLHVRFAGVYTDEQESAVYEKVVAFDDELREKYFTEDMEIGEWKKFQHENDFDKLREDNSRKLFAEEQSVLKGGWEADIPIAEPKSEQFTIETEHAVYVFDELSMYVSNDKNYDPYDDDFDLSKEETCGSAVFLKNGDIIITDPYILKSDISTDPETDRYILEGTPYKKFAYSRGVSLAGSSVCDGSVYCYSRPISLDEIDKAVEYTHYWDEDGTEHFNEYVVFESE